MPVRLRLHPEGVPCCERQARLPIRQAWHLQDTRRLLDAFSHSADVRGIEEATYFSNSTVTPCGVQQDGKRGRALFRTTPECTQWHIFLDECICKLASMRSCRLRSAGCNKRHRNRECRQHAPPPWPVHMGHLKRQPCCRPSAAQHHKDSSGPVSLKAAFWSGPAPSPA